MLVKRRHLLHSVDIFEVAKVFTQVFTPVDFQKKNSFTTTNNGKNSLAIFGCFLLHEI